MADIANNFIISLIAHMHNAQLLFSLNDKGKKSPRSRMNQAKIGNQMIYLPIPNSTFSSSFHLSYNENLSPG